MGWPKGKSRGISPRKGKTYEQIYGNEAGEVRRKIRTNTTELWTDAKYREKQSIAHQGKIQSEGTKAKRCTSMKGKNTSPQSEEHKAKIYASCTKHPNKAEAKLNFILQEIYPGRIEFVGYKNSKIKIAGLEPDFIFTDGQRKVIEHFGNHWHKPEEEQERIDRYATEDWECLVIWESELYDVETLKQKLLNFIRK